MQPKRLKTLSLVQPTSRPPIYLRHPVQSNHARCDVLSIKPFLRVVCGCWGCVQLDMHCRCTVLRHYCTQSLRLTANHHPPSLHQLINITHNNTYTYSSLSLTANHHPPSPHQLINITHDTTYAITKIEIKSIIFKMNLWLSRLQEMVICWQNFQWLKALPPTN